VTPQNAVDPIAGEIQHGRSTQDQMRISYIDDLATDRTSVIQGLSIGDVISDGVFDWTVQSNADQGTWALVGVTPATVSVAGIRQFDFQTVTATPIDIPSDPAYWASSPFPFIQGLIGVDVAYADITTNTNAYGVDILTQPAYIPDEAEWHLKIIASGGTDSATLSAGQTSNGGDGIPEAPIDGTGYVRKNAAWAAEVGGGDLLAVNNLSDLDNAATARSNLDVDIAGTDNSPPPLTDPDFTYTSDVLTRIDYSNGSYKLFSYDLNDRLEIIDHVDGAITVRKEFFYGPGGELDYITQGIV